MKIDLSFIPQIKVVVTTTEGGIDSVDEVESAHLINYPVGQFVAEKLEQRSSPDNALVEYRMATELRKTNQVNVTKEEANILIDVVHSFQEDNLFKGQILHAINIALNPA